MGLGLRLYNPDTQQWTLYWADNRNSPGSFQPPVTGSFSNGIGTFTGADEFNGQPIVVRFTWESLGSGRARWEQAFSTDNGKTWETNWTMDFTRISVIGGYITAMLAPGRPMRHAIILGIVGTVAGAAGAVVAWNLAPHWFPIALVITALPCTWFGGKLRTKSRPDSTG